MKTAIAAIVLALFSVIEASAQTKPLTIAQCEQDSTAWIGAVNKGGTDFKTLSFNDLLARAHEMDSCRFEVVPKPSLLPSKGETIQDASILYALELERWIDYERLSWIYAGEALHRATLFIKDNQLDERFWQFNSGYTKANQ